MYERHVGSGYDHVADVCLPTERADLVCAAHALDDQRQRITDVDVRNEQLHLADTDDHPDPHTAAVREGFVPKARGDGLSQELQRGHGGYLASLGEQVVGAHDHRAGSATRRPVHQLLYGAHGWRVGNQVIDGRKSVGHDEGRCQLIRTTLPLPSPRSRRTTPLLPEAK